MKITIGAFTSIFLVSACLNINNGGSYTIDHFDFTHVELALDYFESLSETTLSELTKTDAALHLKRHSDRTGYFPDDATAKSITMELLADTPPPEKRQQVRNLIAYALRNPEQQRACQQSAL